MGYKRDLILSNIQLIQGLHKVTNSFTETAKLFCEEQNIEYDDSWRRVVSHVLNDENDNDISPAKILIFDIETAPLYGAFWGIWKQNINLNAIQTDWFVLTWAAKWLFDSKVMTGRLTSQEAINQDDKRIMQDLWDLLEEADIVIAHNGKNFDVKRINTRFLKHGITPPMPYQIIDTLLHARKSFAISSNKLDYIAKMLGLEGKLQHSGMELWDRCYKGDDSAFDEMEEYNIQDVFVLEEVYLKLRPWIKPHPNIGLFIGDNVQCCSSCGSDNLRWEGKYNTYANTYQAYRCGSCGSIGRSRKAITNIKTNSNLTISTP